MTIKDAAIEAGLSEKTARQSGSRMARLPAVVDHVKRLDPEFKTKQPKSRAKVRPPVLDKLPDAPPVAVVIEDPLVYLTIVMNDTREDPRVRLDAAKALLPYKSSKAAEAGKKTQRQESAKQAVAGRFAPPKAPKLGIVK